MPTTDIARRSPITRLRSCFIRLLVTRCGSKECPSSMSILSRDPRSSRFLSKRPRRGRRGCERSQAELRMSQLRSPFDVGFINHDGNLDFGSGDQLNFDPGFSETMEEPGSHAGM